LSLIEFKIKLKVSKCEIFMIFMAGQDGTRYVLIIIIQNTSVRRTETLSLKENNLVIFKRFMIKNTITTL
jgi:hypothetical protein